MRKHTTTAPVRRRPRVPVLTTVYALTLARGWRDELTPDIRAGYVDTTRTDVVASPLPAAWRAGDAPYRMGAVVGAVVRVVTR